MVVMLVATGLLMWFIVPEAPGLRDPQPMLLGLFVAVGAFYPGIPFACLYEMDREHKRRLAAR